MNQKLFGITGWKNSGKTTMTERLVACLTARGYRIATIKHAHHNFDIDHEGTDSSASSKGRSSGSGYRLVAALRNHA